MESEDVARLRIESRRKYLKKRKEDKLSELEEKIIDDEALFDEEELTERERKNRAYNKELLRIAKEHEKARELENIQRYQMPDEQSAGTSGKYVEVDKDELEPFSEQKKWEACKMQTAKLKFGSRNESKADEGKEYELLIDNQIEFEMIAAEARKRAGSVAADRKKEKTPVLSESQRRKLDIEQTRKSLPIFKFKQDIIDAVKNYQVLILEGETGCGKTTQLPQYLHEAGYTRNEKRIAVTQPRRVAAMSVAGRVASEMGVKLGNEVGYQIRFEDRTSEKTVIKYMTDGTLHRELLSEPELDSYSVLIIDEAHERTLHTDILFGIVKDVIRAKKELKLIISSATLDSEKFSSFFDEAPILRIPGRRYPVDIYYTKSPEADYVSAAIVSVLQIHVTQPFGDILVFLTGQEEIEDCQEILKDRIRRLGSQIKELIVLPLYSNLPNDMQLKIFEPTPPSSRKVILSTNIAETSLTIDNIIYVIDTGYVKQNIYNPKTGIDNLNVVPISKASANQRSGRAGRVAAGKCFRLFTSWSYENELEDNTVPEIQRMNLGNAVLMLKAIGIDDLVGFDFLDPPPHQILLTALEQLYALNALNHRGDLTSMGKKMADLPLDPMMSKMLIQSEEYNCTEETSIIAAMLSVNSAIFYRPRGKEIYADAAKKRFHHRSGDHLTLLNVYKQWQDSDYSIQWCYDNYIQFRSMNRAREIRDQLVTLLQKIEVKVVSGGECIDDCAEGVCKSIVSGYFYYVARLSKDGTYRTTKQNQCVQIHPSSAIFEDLPRWVVYHELVLTKKEYLRQVTEIEGKWLLEIAPHYYKPEEVEDVKSRKMPKTVGRAITSD